MKKLVLWSATIATLALPVMAADRSDADSFEFTISVFGEWHDNRNHVSGKIPAEPVTGLDYKKQHSYKFGIGPGIRFKHRSRTTELDLGYYPIYHWWTESEIGQEESELTHELIAFLRYLSGERLDIVFRNSLKYNDDPDIYLGHGVDFPEDTSRRIRTDSSHIENRMDLGVKYLLSERFFAKVDSMWRIRRYDRSEHAHRGDEDEFGLSLNLGYQQTAFLSYGAYVGHNWFDRKNEDRLENGEEMEMGVEWTSVGLFTTYRFSEGARVTARYGYQYVTYENDDIDSRSYPTDAGIELKSEPTRRTQVTLGGRLTVREGYDYPYVDQELRAVYAGLAYNHTARITSTYRAEFRSSKYENRYTNPETPDDAYYADDRHRGRRNGKRDETFLRFGVNYRCTENLTLTGYYSYEDMDSDVSRSYTANIIGLRGTYRF